MSRVKVPATLVLLALVGCLLTLVGSSGAAAADAPGDRTVPAPNAVVGTDQFELRVFPEVGQPDGPSAGGRAGVRDSRGVEVAAVHLAADPAGGLVGTVPPLSTGVHLVSWES